MGLFSLEAAADSAATVIVAVSASATTTAIFTAATAVRQPSSLTKKASHFNDYREFADGGIYIYTYMHISLFFSTETVYE